MRAAMNGLGVYRDDHEASVWQSIMDNRAAWTVLQIYLENGGSPGSKFQPYAPIPEGSSYHER